MKTFIQLLCSICLALFVSCGSDDDNNDTSDKSLSPTDARESVSVISGNINSIAIPAGLQNNDDPNALQVAQTFTYLQSLTSAFSSFLVIPENAATTGLGQKDFGIQNTTNYTWSAEGITVNYTITENSDSYTYVYNVVSADFSGKLFEGTASKDGSSFNLTLFDESGASSVTVAYAKGAASEILTLTSGDEKMVFSSSINDDSGSIKVYESNTLTSEMKWNADGSGSITDFEQGKTFTWMASVAQ